jgi:hypothetical protein
MGMKYCRYIPNGAKRLAFLLPVSNINLSSFSVAEGTAGKDWLKRFMKRRTDKLSFQKSWPELQDLAEKIWGLSLNCSQKNLQLMITHLYLY